MTDIIARSAEDWFGIKADPDDIIKLEEYLWKTYGGADSDILDKVFSSGEAAGFLTVNETYFFREFAHFSLLRSILPAYEKSGIKICSAAVASGCEAYSIAMIIEAYNKSLEKPLPYHIDAFDINPKVIETADKGIYNTRALREDGRCFWYLADQYLKKITDGYRVEPALKNNITFFIHNLMKELPGKGYDIIFFRNAFIYFSRQNRDRILSNLSLSLKDGGTLIMGVSETAGVNHGDFELINRNDVFYFKKSAGNASKSVC